MQDLELQLRGGASVRVAIRRHAQARRITLRVDAREQIARITIPKSAARRDAVRFASEQVDWIASHLARLPKPIALAPGAGVPLLGRERRIVHDAAFPARVRESEDRLQLGGHAEDVGPRVLAWLKRRARREIAARAEAFGSRAGLAFDGIALRDTRSRWGSCSAAGRLSFSWRLVMAPAGVLDYVVAHEVSHLRHMNHGPEFWAVVDGLVPDRRAARRWLRENGAQLQRYCAARPEASGLRPDA